MKDEHWHQLKAISISVPNKRVSLSLEALIPGIEFASLAVNVLRTIFSKTDRCDSTEHWLFSVAPLVVILARSSG